ncbi:cytidylate kinase-like family protein [Clostridium sp. MSJ-8]|uniref:cytidylate kinase-like family protein n=1 Tax=Clostridium sp. MSJ-8 TaxID=2841510 RepID=UPI001C0EAC70|nr:cytidylate kinase-like family protein [Clostridium sp. MSJ-8]MBU5488491.1 cytidylate kinase-like family protein [Clostridium sp. MSJ-8]
MKYVITISREFGCAARDIGHGISSQLGLKFYDKDMIDLVAQKAGIHVDIIKENDEKVTRTLKEFLYGSSTNFYSEKAIQAQAEVVREIADKETCVIFGRCSDYFLREYSNCFNIFLYAPLEYRIKHIAEAYGLDEKAAEKMVKKVDKQRHNYYKYVTGKNRGDRDGKNIMVDVSYFGVDGTVDLICKAIKQKFNIE